MSYAVDRAAVPENVQRLLKAKALVNDMRYEQRELLATLKRDPENHPRHASIAAYIKGIAHELLETCE